MAVTMSPRCYSRSVTKNRPVNMTLNLECIEEPLSEAQLAFRNKQKENFNRVNVMFEDLVKEDGGTLIRQSGPVAGYQYTLPATAPPLLTNQSNILSVNSANAQPIKLNMLNNSNPGQGNIQLLIDPRGTILGTVASSQGTQPTATTTTNRPPVVVSSTTLQNSVDNLNKIARRRPKSTILQATPLIPAKSTSTLPDIILEEIEEPVPTVLQARRNKIPSNTSPTPQTMQAVRVKSMAKTSTTTALPTVTSTGRPAEHSSIGGIAVGSKNAVGDQIDESKKNLPDGREILFNKVNGGRTFPSLVVVARPNLKAKNITTQVSQKDRTDLDLNVKSVLMFTATKFAEWLIQKGLVRSEQYCLVHSNDSQKIKLKLGMYSDSGTFPYSGGYVWISSCCPERFVSVFNGSIFQGAPHSPTVLLKLIYHWACQTNVQNVVSWVKVSNIYVKNFYTNLRSVCTAAICDKSRQMGGKNSMIQVGVISLGTTSQDGNLRQVKVEVLGVLDPETLDLKLRACDPVHDGDRSYKRRFNNILHPLKEWVHKDSKILTDFTVDKTTLYELGFTNITQATFTDQNPRNVSSNYHIMEYLRKIVPRMFQNTLSLLSRQMIQQFLDELVWRETYGLTAGRAFDNIITHIAEQTKLDTNGSLLDRLAKVAANPFHDWSYSKNMPVIRAVTPQSDQGDNLANRRIRKRTAIPVVPDSDSVKRINLGNKENNKNDKATLQEIYYATMEGDRTALAKEQKSSVHFKCFLSDCTAIMRTNTEVMEHIIGHVPARMPNQSDSLVCHYCCTLLSTKSQREIHITETHSNFGQTDASMMACAICEEKFLTANLLVQHLTNTHYPSEMPYRCDTCGYRTSSHRDAIDHFYKAHNKGEGLQCPLCLKVILLTSEGNVNSSNVHAYLFHMQRHILRREEGRGNKCARCCLWFNQKSALKQHQRELHTHNSGSKVIPYTGDASSITIPRVWHFAKRAEVDKIANELPSEEIRKWKTGPIRINLSDNNYPCQECEDDIDGENHYPGVQKCSQCRYVTCCWRAFKEHQRQIHNERPLTSLIVPSPLINIPLDIKMQCSCGYSTYNGDHLATHLVKCNKKTALPSEEAEPSGMLDSLGLIPKNTSDSSA